MELGVSEKSYLHPHNVGSRPSLLGKASSYQDLRPRSRLRIEDDNSEADSIGNLSIEPAPWQSSTSITTTASGRQKTLGMAISLKKSTDRLWEKIHIDRNQHGLGIADNAVTKISSLPSSSSIAESASNRTLSARSPRSSDRASPDIAGWTARRYSVDLTGSPVVGHGRVVPSRQSSLRHSFACTSTRQNQKSRKSNSFTAEGNTEPSADDKIIFTDVEVPPMDSDDPVQDEVTRRIVELKYQKRLRDISMTVTTPDLIPPSPRASRSPSPLCPTQQSNIPASPRIEGNLANGVVIEKEIESMNEDTAPSPAIVQRTQRTNKRYSLGSKPQGFRPFSTLRPAEPNRAHTTPIQRSNSLLKRLSRPISPNSLAKHRRTLSNPLSEPFTPIERPKSTDSIDDAVDEYLSAPRLSQKTKHPVTDRIITFSEVGDPHGSVVVCCVGMGLTRFIMSFYDDLAKTLKLRLITPDRPGVGGSEVHADGADTPLGWPDDVLAICSSLKITKFSLLAHSAGAIYALATALRMPQYIRGRIHLLAPWIPPSQMSGIGTHQEPLPVSALPLTQRFLQSLPTRFLKAANSSYLRTTSASITTSLPKSPRRSNRSYTNGEAPTPGVTIAAPIQRDSLKVSKKRGSTVRPDSGPKELIPSHDSDSDSGPSFIKPVRNHEKERRTEYDSRLTEAIWDSSTTGANPAVDLLVCLERKQPIGFRYVDITRSVIIHHGSKDARVPVENVKWLGKTMRRCDVRVLEGEGHGLMASAAVMGNVLMEIAREWDDWIRVVQGKGRTERKGFSP